MKKYAVSAVMLSSVLLCTPLSANASEESQLDSILSEILTDNMTGSEKLEAITKYTAENFSYSPYYQRWTDMLDYGGGDCWANTDMIYQLAVRAGISCIRQDSSLRPNSGTGHINLIAFIDGHYYQAESGYAGEKPRVYTFTDIGTQPFFFTSDESEVTFSRYIGFDSVYEIPSELGGKPVSSIASYAFSTKQLTDYSYNNSKLCFSFWKWKFSKVEELTIPESITAISPSAFQYSMLKAIEIPESVTVIPKKAFYGSENLKEVTLPATLTEIESDAFSECNSLETVHFLGTEEEWNSIAVSEDNTSLLNAKVDFSTQVTKIAGDVNGDGEFSIADVILLQKWLLAVPDTHLADWQTADFCTDGKLDVYDFCLMRKKLVNG